VAARSGASAAGKRAAGRRGAKSRVRSQVDKASSPINSGMTAEQVNEELQHRRSVAAAAAEAEKDETEAAEESPPAARAGRDTSRDVGVVAKLDRIDGVHSGSGFVLGLIAWVVAANYLQGGLPQVKKLARAKFLNRTS